MLDNAAMPASGYTDAILAPQPRWFAAVAVSPFERLEAWRLAESMVHGTTTPEVEVDDAEGDVDDEAAGIAAPPSPNPGSVSAKPAAANAAKRMVAGRTPLGNMGNLQKTKDDPALRTNGVRQVSIYRGGCFHR